jgi:uncharacterized protein YqgV (UPF0045/DUF77 family)
MTNSIIVSLQIIPIGEEKKSAEAMTKSLAIIEQSGLRYHHEALSVSMEGSFEQIMRVVEAVQLASFNSGAAELHLNIQLKALNGKDLKLKR